jgi:hypothetical protein
VSKKLQETQNVIDVEVGRLRRAMDRKLQGGGPVRISSSVRQYIVILSPFLNDRLATSFPLETTLKKAVRNFTWRRDETSAENGREKRLGWRVPDL